MICARCVAQASLVQKWRKPVAEPQTTPTTETERLILEKVRTLPDHRQREVLDFVEFVELREARRQPRRSLEGLWSDLGISITEEDIAQARREMWGSFPREDI
jgi:hypothetical protein